MFTRVYVLETGEGSLAADVNLVFRRHGSDWEKEKDSPKHYG